MTNAPLPEVFADVNVEHHQGFDAMYVILYRHAHTPHRRATALRNLWPQLTDDERRLVIGAALMRTVEEDTVEIFIGEHEVTLWYDGEVWIDHDVMHNKLAVVTHLERQKAEEDKRAANT